MPFKEKLVKEKLPKHVALIMDGNGRWAKQKGKPRVFGHKNGVVAVREVSEGAAEIGLSYLTLYTFSTENWSRPKAEINALMSLLVSTIHKEIKTLLDNNIRLLSIGDHTQLPSKVHSELYNAIEQTAHCTGLSLVLALSYSSRWEIVNAMKKIAIAIQNNTIQPDQISETLISQYLTTANIPDPELLIRTSGEYRISNFLLWQIAYSELYFTQKMWPDFRREDLYEALYEYQQRERRFGKTSDQLIK